MTDKPIKCNACHKKTLTKIGLAEFQREGCIKYEYECSFCKYFVILTEEAVNGNN